MPLRSLRDFQLAFDEGRTWQSIYMKTTEALGGSGHFRDYSFSSGIPRVDQRVGAGLVFAPVVNDGNDGIYLPKIGADQHLHLVGYEGRFFAATASNPFTRIVYDLLGYYPLIDGSSNSLQAFDNAASLPRYTDGVGVQMMLVNHIAPIAAIDVATIEYVDADGVTRTTTAIMRNVFGAGALGVSSVVSGAPSGANLGNPWIFTPGARGVRRVNSIQFANGPDGYYTLMLVKPILQAGYSTDDLTTGVNVYIPIERHNLLENGCHAPRILPGASLNLMGMTGGDRASANFLHFTFAWG